jgi:radical SAM superfamily enzyme YgiQ (UPF0313 family)
MYKPRLLLIHPGQDKDRFGTRRRKKSSIPKLNLPILAAYAVDRFEVNIIDEAIEDIDFDVKADLVGITIMTQLSQRGYEIADAFRERGAKIVMGGFHAYFFPSEAEQHADALVLGESEGPWERVLEDFLSGNLKKRYQTDRSHNLAGLPSPRLDLIKREAYSFHNIVETARGCPHKCVYCAVTLYWGNKFRFRPVNEVINEIRALPSGDIVFVDDNIVGAPKRAKELFRSLIPLKRRWSGQADMKIARDPELLDLAAKSGCQWLFMGIESVNENNLRDVGKAVVNNVEKFRQSLALIREAGIKVFGSFIFGLDHDDRSVFDETVQFCVENRIEGANFYIFTPLPFTNIFDKMEEEDRILHRNWSKYDMNHVVFKPMKMTPEELLEGYLGAYRSFYSFGSIIKRVLQPRRDLGEILALNIGRRLNYRKFEQGCRL